MARMRRKLLVLAFNHKQGLCATVNEELLVLRQKCFPRKCTPGRRSLCSGILWLLSCREWPRRLRARAAAAGAGAGAAVLRPDQNGGKLTATNSRAEEALQAQSNLRPDATRAFDLVRCHSSVSADLNGVHL